MANLLIIDDEPTLRRMLRLALESAGHSVTLASDGAEGLAAFGDGDGWDLTLLDYRMPGLDGLEVLREIRTRAPGGRVVMITAFGTIDLAADARELGATDFLRKPFTLELLRECVETALALVSEPLAPSLSFEGAGINGFRLKPTWSSRVSENTGFGKEFLVRRGLRSGTNCRVTLASPIGQRLASEFPNLLAHDIQTWLCADCLANYLWQNATLPPHNHLRVDDLSRGQWRRLEGLQPEGSQSSAARVS